MRDKQQQLVYDWENRVVKKFDLNIVPFQQIKNIVDYVWEKEGLKYPPKVELIPKQKHSCGDANRLRVRFRAQTFTWIILHELSHSMSSLCTGESNQHGALFMGLYCQLLSRYLGFNFSSLVESAKSAGLRVNEDAKPVFKGE